MATSTFLAVKTAVIDGLKARPALSGVQVAWGIPKALERELIVVLGADGEQVFGALGGRRRDESLEVDVTISVTGNDSDQERVSRRALALFAEVEAFLRDDPTLGGIVRSAEIGPRFTVGEPARGDTREGFVEFVISTHARI